MQGIFNLHFATLRSEQQNTFTQLFPYNFPQRSKLLEDTVIMFSLVDDLSFMINVFKRSLMLDQGTFII